MSDYDAHFPAAVKMETNWNMSHDPNTSQQITTGSKDHVWSSIGGNYYQCIVCNERKELGDELDD